MLISLLKNTFRNLLDNLFLFDGYKLDHSAAAVSYDMTLIPSQPASISQVDDISGNGNHLFQSVSSLMPSNAATLNGLSVLKFDEDYIKEISHNMKFDIGRAVSEENTSKIFKKIKGYIPKLISGDQKANMFVRIKTNKDQTKQVALDTELTVENSINMPIMEQAFVRHEKVVDFNPKLSSSHSELRTDMIEKMIDIIHSL